MSEHYVAPAGLPFRPGSMTWRVNMEPVIAAGGGRALLLQVLHPLVAAGVDQHSNFADDPFRRGFRTADVMLKLAFGDVGTSMKQSDLLERVHAKVTGTADDGRTYRALDPDLLVWVWATLLDVSLLMYERGVGPLSDLDRERYYQEQKLIAHACGVPADGCPATYDDFRAYWAQALDELEVTKVSRIVAYAGRHVPLPRPVGTLLGSVVTLVTAGLLPDRLRDELGYTWSPARQRALDALLLGSRITARVTPSSVRHLVNRYLVRRKTALNIWRHRAVDLPEELTA